MNLKSILATSAAAGALALSLPAHAGNYISLFGGLSAPDGDVITVGPFTYTRSSLVKMTAGGAYINSAIFNFPRAGVYAKVHNASLSWVFKSYTVSVTTASAFKEGDYDNGFVIGGAFGHSYGNGFRAEIEAAWRKYDFGGRHQLSGVASNYKYAFFDSDLYDGTIYLYTQPLPNLLSPTSTVTQISVHSASHFGTTTTPVTGTARTSGEVTAFSIMANIWYDFDLGTSSPFTPFIGAGLGMADLQFDYSGSITLPYTTGHFNTSTDDWVFAWQLGAGLGYEFENGMMISAQYRYFATGDASVAGQDVGISANEGLIALNIPFGN